MGAIPLAVLELAHTQAVTLPFVRRVPPGLLSRALVVWLDTRLAASVGRPLGAPWIFDTDTMINPRTLAGIGPRIRPALIAIRA